MNWKKQLANIDYSIIIAVCILSVFGIICIGSATHINLGEDSTNFYAQMAWFAIGLLLMTVAAFVDYQYFARAHVFIYGINIILLLSVFVIGSTVNGAVRWIRLGPVSIQPSEFAKIMMIFCLAKMIDKKRETINSIGTLLFLLIYTLIPVFLIMKQPSLSVSLVILAIFTIQIFVGGLSYRIIAGLSAVGIPTLGFVFWDVQRADPILMDKVLANHQIDRLLGFLQPERFPDNVYQTMKSINAIGSGQLYGKGLYQGTLNQLSYLPEPHTDFIFSIIGEEFGFIGCAATLLVLLFLIFRCAHIAMKARDLFSQLIAAGVAGMLAFQVFVHVGVVTGMLPNTGMPLPFVSYGGSSMWANMVGIGLVINIGRCQSKNLFEGGVS